MAKQVVPNGKRSMPQNFSLGKALITQAYVRIIPLRNLVLYDFRLCFVCSHLLERMRRWKMHAPEYVFVFQRRAIAVLQLRRQVPTQIKFASDSME